jgi:hypothetical protein
MAVLKNLQGIRRGLKSADLRTENEKTPEYQHDDE